MAADVGTAHPLGLPLAARPARRYAEHFGWTVVVVTIGAILVGALAGPRAGATPAVPVAWLFFVGSSVHVAATVGLFSFAGVREHARHHAGRYLVMPGSLLMAAMAASLVLPSQAMSLLLLGFFMWQFWHYQKQNLGLASLAMASARLPALSRVERRCIGASGVGGILALVAHPSILQLVAWRPGPSLAAATHLVAELVLAGCAVTATACALRRWRAAAATPAAITVTLLAVLFPVPLVLTSSPYAALGGLTLAHGLQYLLLVGHVMAGPPTHRGASPSPTVLVAVAALVVAAAGALATASHLHGGRDATARLLFGAYVAAVMTHFVVDAGLWRLRDEFPRRWLGVRIPQLLGRPTG